MSDNGYCQRLAQQVIALHHSLSGGISPLKNVSLMYSDKHLTLSPVMYRPGIAILFQGSKTGYLGDVRFSYDPSRYLLLSVALPVECETHGSREHPLAGLFIDVDMLSVQEMILEIGEQYDYQPPQLTTAIHSAELTHDMLRISERLLDMMTRPLEARLLANQVIKEMYFYLLTGPCGRALLSLANSQTRISQIAKALRRIEQDYRTGLSIDVLAAEVNMSTSAFYHHFKTVTQTSPLQYLKRYRLHEARRLLAHQQMKAGNAAIEVGYESVSQFSREYKRYFGVTPGEEIQRVRQASADA